MEKLVRVFPSLGLHPLEYLPGIGAEGAELPEKEAEDLVKRGLATKSKPKSAEPAEKSEEG